MVPGAMLTRGETEVRHFLVLLEKGWEPCSQQEEALR